MSTLLEQTVPNHGFILTRQQYDVAGALTYELWVASVTGVCKLLISHQEAVCFVETKDFESLRAKINEQNLKIRHKSITLKSFNNEPVVALYAKSLRSYYKLKQVAETYQIELLEADIKPVDRFLMERHIKGHLEFVGELSFESAIYKEYLNVKIKSGKSNAQTFSILSVDIECNEKGELFSIGMHAFANGQQWHKDYSKVLYNCAGVQQSLDSLAEQSSSLPYIEWLDNETVLLTRFVEEVQALNPDMLVGWNFIGFDIRLIERAAKRLNIPLTLGRDHSLLYFSDGQSGQNRFPDRAYVAGRVVLDGIDVMKNATYHFDSFALDNVARQLLSDQKIALTDESGDKLAEIKRLYKEEPLKLAEYNLQDCKLVSRIFQQEKLTEYLVTRSELTGLELDKTGGSVAAFTNLYMPKMHRQGWVAPNLVNMEDYVHSPGGFVMDSVPGIHSDVLVFDFKSLYPSIIRTFNVDPITLVKAEFSDDNDNLIEGFRGGRFTRDKSILSSMLDELWQARERAKQQNNAIHSNAIKIIMNSFYGVLGSAGCRFYDTKLASSITMRGHWVLNESKRWFHQNGLEVIYGDTDSVFVSLAGSTYTSEDGAELENKLNRWWQAKIKEDFELESKLEMEFETHYSPFFMPTIRGTDAGSKKRYAGKKRNSDGSEEIVFKGLESVRSDWTPLAKSFQQQLFELIFNNRPVESYIRETLEKLRAGELDDECVYRKRIRQHLSEYVKTTPPQIKAARDANVHYGRELYGKGSAIRYVITPSGPRESSLNTLPLDYEHYISKQLFPIAESILHTNAPEVLSVFNKQLFLF